MNKNAKQHKKLAKKKSKRTAKVKKEREAFIQDAIKEKRKFKEHYSSLIKYKKLKNEDANEKSRVEKNSEAEVETTS